MSELRLEGVHFHWPDRTDLLFPPLTFHLQPGTIATIMGENGSGKTTFVEIIGGRREPSGGQILLNGTQAPPEQYSYLPQDSSRLLFPHLTIQQNIDLRGGAPRFHSGSSEQLLFEVLFPDLTTLKRYPARCSGGQRQRAALCRAVLEISSFPVTLLDEPFAQLSREAKAAVVPTIRHLTSESRNVAVIVTHDLLDAMLLGDCLVTIASERVSTHDTSRICDESDFWRAADVREAILRATHEHSLV